MAIVTDEYVPARQPTQATIELTGTAKNLGGVTGSTVQSNAGFDAWSASAWYVGDSSAQARLVAANEPFSIPSCSLSGWYAKSSSGTISLIVTAANRVST